MANPAESEVQNLLPVQAYFDVQGNFQTFIGQNKPFYAIPDPQQSGLQITNSTINSSVIGGITPSTGTFTNIATTTGTVSTTPANQFDLVNKAYVDATAQGLSFKQPALVASTANIPSLSGLLTIDGVTLVAGNRVLVKNQTTQADNGIYVASAGAWSRSLDANTWDELLAAYLFILEGTIWEGSAWVCTDAPGGTLGVTAVNFVQFSNNAIYTAGTGLTLTGFEFSITNTGVSAASYGSASKTVTLAINAQGQTTSASQQDIAIAGTQITSGTIDSARLSGSYSGITGLGTLTDLTVTNAIVGSITGNAATATTAGSATSATTATNLAGGATGSLPYQTASGATGFLAAGTNGQILALASGVPSWIDNQVGTVTSVSGTGTVSGISLSGTVTSTGSLTLGGTLDLSSPPAIGGTTANTVRGTTITATSSFVGTNFDASGSGGGSLRNLGGTACLQWGGGGGVNVTIDGAINMNGANSAIQINPTGTGTVSIAPAGALTVNPTTASTMNNVAIGGTTPLAGTFTTLRVNSTISLAGSTGTSGYVLTSNGASAPTWQANANGLAITDDTTTNATRYLTFTDATNGSITGANVSSTKLQFNPSTGALGVAGNLAFTGTGNRITGDFSNGTITNQVAFQTSTANSNTTVGAIPSGTGVLSGFRGFNNSDPTNAGYIDITVSNTQARVRAGITGTGTYLPLAFATNNAEAMRIDTSGNVGIGTSSPGTKLDVAGTIRSTSGNIVAVDGGAFGWGTTTAYVGGTSASNLINFVTSSTERMRIDSSGNLLVNTTTVLNSGRMTLDYAGNSANGITINDTTSTNGSAFLSFFTGGTSRGSVSNNNNTGVLYNVTSDYRLKTVVAPVSDAGTRLDALQPIEYDWNTGGRTRGFLAHQFAEVYPNSVSGKKDALDAKGKPVYQAMQASTPEVMADLIAEIQSLRKRVAQLESK